jgi:EmrB/QacA subfamily drug resistance transporter
LHPLTDTLDDHDDRRAPPRVDGGGPASRRYKPTVAVAVAVAAFGAFLAFMDSTVVNVAFPNLEAAFPHASVGDLSWILNAYNIVFAGLLVLAGRFADLLGRRRLFKIGLVVFTVTSGLCALSTSIDMLIVFRIFQGAGAAMLVPASLGVVVHASPIEHRSHSLSLWAAAGALAAGLGPPIGGGLVDLYNWRLVFVINVPLGIIAWLLVRRTVIESRAPGRRLMPDLRGALVLSLALAAVTLGIVQGSSWGWASPATVVTFVIAAACAGLAVESSRRHRSPILDPALLRVRGFTVSNLIAILAGLGLYTYLLTHILWLHYVWGYSLLLAGLAVAPGAVVAAITAGPFGKLADRFGPRVVVVPGAVVWAGAYVWYTTRVGLHPDFLGRWLPGQVISGIGVGATLPVATSGGLATVPAGRYATEGALPRWLAHRCAFRSSSPLSCSMGASSWTARSATTARSRRSPRWRRVRWWPCGSETAARDSTGNGSPPSVRRSCGSCRWATALSRTMPQQMWPPSPSLPTQGVSASSSFTRSTRPGMPDSGQARRPWSPYGSEVGPFRLSPTAVRGTPARHSTPPCRSERAVIVHSS